MTLCEDQASTIASLKSVYAYSEDKIYKESSEFLSIIADLVMTTVLLIWRITTNTSIAVEIHVRYFFQLIH